MAGLGVPPGVSLRGGVTTMSTEAATRLDDVESDVSDLQALPIIADVPAEVTGARDETEGAGADLLTVLETLGLITDSTTAS